MNDLDVSVSADTIAYLVDGVKGWFKKDFATKTEREWLETLVRVAAVESSTIRCVGMARPIPLERIYVPTIFENNRKKLSMEACFENRENAIVLAGPGYGKTTFLRWAFTKMSHSENYVPLLFTLRRPEAIDDLTHLIDLMRTGMARRVVPNTKERRLILLVDGYDEISLAEQKRVSELLLKFEAADSGNFYLTCRAHYAVYELKAPHYSLAPFSKENAKQYILNLAEAQSIAVDPEAIISELDSKDFSSFWQHPLLLTLIMILKSTPSSTIPNSSIGLIKRAIETLSFRWDEEKGINRESACDIDAPDREECLKFIAYEMDTLIASDERVVQLATKFLELIGRHDVPALKFLVELARFYGLLIPTDDGEWTFTHKTIHDYLAAKFSVEHGIFSPGKVREWNARAAYAGCMLMDATETITTSLRRTDDLTVLTECLSNTRRYNRQDVAQACIAHFMSFPKQLRLASTPQHIRLETEDIAWLRQSDDELLFELLTSCLQASKRPEFTSSTYQAVVVLALCELARRKREIPYDIRQSLPFSYQVATFKVRFNSPKKDVSIEMKLGN